MEATESEYDECALEIIPIHFNVPGHHLSLKTFIETATQTDAIIATFNEKLFEGQLKYQLLIFPPEPGTFKSKLGILVVAWGVVWSFTESDIGKAFIKGVTGHEPAYWAELAGEEIKQQLMNKAKASELEETELKQRQKCHAEAVVLSEVTKSFLQKDVSELSQAGVDPQKFRDAYEARNLFYKSCAENNEVRSIGFEEAEVFPIKRKDFAILQVALPPNEEEAEKILWQVDITTLQVTSPNWDKNDKYRLWKGKDNQGRDRLFRIEDEYFWHLVKNDRLDPHIKDTLKVQWAFRMEDSRYRDMRVLKVLEYNNEVLGLPLDENSLLSLLGRYSLDQEAASQRDLFSP